jgi:hydroxysqualene dehydroxylase
MHGLRSVPVKIAVIGAGWAGCAAAVEATRRGHQVVLFEAARIAGGRARRVDAMVGGQPCALDNGQHILIGAYTETLKLMAALEVDAAANLLRLPLTLQYPDASGLALPDLPAPLNALAGMLTARGWSWRDKLSLLKLASGWRLRRFQCGAQLTVAQICRGASPRVMATLIEPLCVSALNTPVARASGQVFLRVMHDALFSSGGASDLLLPRADLSALLPEAACAWLQRHGGEVRFGLRIESMQPAPEGWVLAAGKSEASPLPEAFDGIVLACPATEAARLVQGSGVPAIDWLAHAGALQYEAIATVYSFSPGVRLSQPMLALPASEELPAQFVFDRGQLNGPVGLLAFVVSASLGDGTTLSQQVQAQAEAQLGLKNLEIVRTIVEKRATFACTPGLQRPGMKIAADTQPTLLACGDYVQGPYPATLESAVRSGLAAARWIATTDRTATTDRKLSY